MRVVVSLPLLVILPSISFFWTCAFAFCPRDGSQFACWKQRGLATSSSHSSRSPRLPSPFLLSPHTSDGEKISFSRANGLLSWWRGTAKEVEAVPTLPPPIEVGAAVPNLTLTEVFGRSENETNSRRVETTELFGKGLHILIGLPGAFTPTCSSKHVPGYLRLMPKFQKEGVSVRFLASNDKYVIGAWRDSLAACAGSGPLDTDLKFVVDGDLEFALSLGMAEDFGEEVGVRSRRFAMLIKDGVVRNVASETGMFDLDSTSAENMLSMIKAKKQEEGASVVGEEADGTPIFALGAFVILALLLAAPIFGQNVVPDDAAVSSGAAQSVAAGALKLK
mmetsp:Transcript_14951/g.30189  ORF Transcript_14951/g.30189 Transcript_14951/m.30189 type:complete len:335 (+) Transcript_14951:137-1141(+)